jgi:glycosyltransferase involved in cell wall biosynthesis
MAIEPVTHAPVSADARISSGARLRRLPRRPLHVAMIGQRGVPATFGGVEHHVEELGARLADRGHRVTVFCRQSYVQEPLESYRGMRLRHVPSLATKHLDAISHSLAAAVRAVPIRPDVVHYHALGPGLVSPLTRAFSRARVVQTVHGLDGERQKWGRGASRVLKFGERVSAWVPAETIVVSHALEEHYLRRFDRRTWVFPNGAARVPRAPLGALAAKHGLEPGSYLLYVGRIVPEKRVDWLLSAFRRMDTDRRLVIVGGDSFSSDYLRHVDELARRDDRVLQLGYVYGVDLHALYSNTAAFILPSVLEGMPLTLLEAASFEAPIVASDIAPHREVLGESRPGGRLFPPDDADAMLAAIQLTVAGGDVARRDAAHVREHVVSHYDWDVMTDQVEDLYYDMVGVAPGRR